jgi:hypothetical protein
MARLTNGRFPGVELFSVVFTICSIRRRCLIGVIIVEGVISILLRFVVCDCFCCARVFIVELCNGVLPVGKCGIPTRRAVVNGVRKFVL